MTPGKIFGRVTSCPLLCTKYIYKYTMEGKDRQVKRILAFGDSLTEGHTFCLTHIDPRHNHPYTLKLQELLQDNFKTLEFKIDNAGIYGQFAQNEMTTRLPNVLKEKGPYDLVIILAGTNDLGDMFTLGEEKAVFEAIQQLHLTSLASGAKTILITIPESDYIYEDMGKNGSAYVKEQGEKGRCLINEMLREFARTPGVILCDLDKEHPHTTLSQEDKVKYWDDGLHYTPAGYDKMAEIIFEKIKDLQWV